MRRRSVLRLLGATAATQCSICLGLGSALAGAKSGAKSGGHGDALHWEYGGPSGAEHWGELSPRFRVCDLGVQQSPVDLEGGIRAEMGHIPVSYDEMPLRVVNNGHTIQVNCDPGSGIVLDGTRYRLLQFHFHHPSEHLLDGRAFDLEAHFVHVSESGTLAVLGVFFTPGAVNPALASIWDAMPSEAGAERSPGVHIAPATLLPAERGYFRYLGSLTTPPCSQKVIWTVFKTPIEASRAQVRRFAGLFPMNARPAQELHRRFLLESL